MLFYKKIKSQEDLDDIPSSYVVMNIAKSNKKFNHNNIKALPILFTKDELKTIKKKDKEENYIHKLITEYNEHITVLANFLINHKHNQSLVLVCTDERCDDYEFNPAKTICEFIQKRYEYKAYKFTNTVVKSMREESKFTEKGLTRLIKDMNRLRKKV